MATDSRIYICIECEEGCIWQVFDARTCELRPRETHRMNRLLQHTPLKNGSAVLGHCIYLIGGSCVRNVNIYDTKKWEWKYGTNMGVARHNPLVVPVPSYNMLLVFGGTTKEEQNWAECYYIDDDRWEVLQSPDKPKNPNLTGHFILGDTLVLWNQDLFYTFNVKSKTWMYRLELKHHLPTIHGDFFVGGIVPSAVCLDDSLFWFNGVEILNYDLSGEDNTLDSLVSPQEAKTLYQRYFRSLDSFLLALSSDEKMFYLFGREKSVGREESGLHKEGFWLFQFQSLRIDEHGPFSVKLSKRLRIPVPGRACHCLTVQQSSKANRNDKSGSQGDIRCEEDLLKHLSRGMYMKNFLSLTRYKDCEADSAAKPVSGSWRKACAKPVSGSGQKVKISVSRLMEGLMEGLRLAGKYEDVLDRIIDKQVLKQLSEDDLKALKIPARHMPGRCSEEWAEGDSDTEENRRDEMYHKACVLSSGMGGLMLPNLRQLRDEPPST